MVPRGASLLLLLGLLLLVGCQGRAQNYNFGELNNRGLVENRLQCLLDRAPCDNTGSQIKAALPEVLQRNCAKCTRTQKAGARKLIAFAQQRYPAEWAQIQAKYRG